MDKDSERNKNRPIYVNQLLEIINLRIQQADDSTPKEERHAAYALLEKAKLGGEEGKAALKQVHDLADKGNQVASVYLSLSIFDE